MCNKNYMEQIPTRLLYNVLVSKFNRENIRILKFDNIYHKTENIYEILHCWKTSVMSSKKIDSFQMFSSIHIKTEKEKFLFKNCGNKHGQIQFLEHDKEGSHSHFSISCPKSCKYAINSHVSHFLGRGGFVPKV